MQPTQMELAYHHRLFGPEQGLLSSEDCEILSEEVYRELWTVLNSCQLTVTPMGLLYTKVTSSNDIEELLVQHLQHSWNGMVVVESQRGTFYTDTKQVYFTPLTLVEALRELEKKAVVDLCTIFSQDSLMSIPSDELLLSKQTGALL